MAQISLYIGSGGPEVDWTGVGSTPYLDAQDQPTNYIHSSSRNKNSQSYSFDNLPANAVSINSVTLYIYAYGGATNDFEAILGASDATGLGPPTSWGWVNTSVTSILSSVALVNAATVFFDRRNTTNEAGVDAAYLLVDYEESTTAPPTTEEPTTPPPSTPPPTTVPPTTEPPSTPPPTTVPPTTVPPDRGILVGGKLVNDSILFGRLIL